MLGGGVEDQIGWNNVDAIIWMDDKASPECLLVRRIEDKDEGSFWLCFQSPDIKNEFQKLMKSYAWCEDKK